VAYEYCKINKNRKDKEEVDPYDVLDSYISAKSAPASATSVASAGATSTMAAGDTISKLAGRLALVEGQFGLSKWRTAEGKFNTARLASDSIAGVVVGTAGGLLTSKIVKKNQVEDGFEDIQCTIGGQTVAGWGDEFSVGNQM
jgi:hypothetical protein